MLLSLADRCEQATGPEVYLDRAIARAVFDDDPILPARFTASLDAAMTLVPEGWHVSFCGQDRHTQRAHAALERNGGDHGKIAPCEDAATLALALCAASLRSLANKETEK